MNPDGTLMLDARGLRGIHASEASTESPLGDGFFAISAKNMKKIKKFAKFIRSKKRQRVIPGSELIINVLYKIGPCKKLDIRDKLLDDLTPCRNVQTEINDLLNRGRIVKTDKLYDLSFVERVRIHIEKQNRAVSIREMIDAGLQNVESAVTILCKKKKIRQTLNDKFEIAVCRQKKKDGSKKKTNPNL